MEKIEVSQNMDVAVKVLKKAVFNLHGCKSKWIESVPVREVFQGQTVWEGVVQVFELTDHP